MWVRAGVLPLDTGHARGGGCGWWAGVWCVGRALGVPQGEAKGVLWGFESEWLGAAGHAGGLLEESVQVDREAEWQAGGLWGDLVGCEGEEYAAGGRFERGKWMLDCAGFVCK